jgi:D-alanine transfer protein
MKSLLAIAAALFVALTVTLFGLGAALPAQSEVDPALEYGYLCSGTKSESVDFALAACDADTYLLFGSSELNTNPWMVSSAPDLVFGTNDYGMDLMYVGEAYDQSLWLAIAAGAYAGKTPNKKVAIIVSPQWFLDGGLEAGIFKMRFSYNLYQGFCENTDLSEETRAYVMRRLEQEGVDQALIDAGAPTMPQDWINGAVFGFMTDLRLRNALRDVRVLGIAKKPSSNVEGSREGGYEAGYEGNRGNSASPAATAAPPATASEPPGAETTGYPDFGALQEEALAEAQRWSTNNSYAVFDSYWTDYLEPRYAALKNSLAAETLSDTSEYDDLSCFLNVCRESGLEPYVVIAPINGKWYDYAGLSAQARDDFSRKVTAICEDASVACLDMSSHDYEQFYLRDIMHLGWLGWLEVERGFLDFVRKTDSPGAAAEVEAR